MTASRIESWESQGRRMEGGCWECGNLWWCRRDGGLFYRGGRSRDGFAGTCKCHPPVLLFFAQGGRHIPQLCHLPILLLNQCLPHTQLYSSTFGNHEHQGQRQDLKGVCVYVAKVH